MNTKILRIILLLMLFLSSCKKTINSSAKEINQIETPSSSPTMETKTEITVPASGSFKGKQWTKVINELKELGFQNVSTITIDDIDSHSDIKDGEVESVTIDDQDDYSEGDVFSYDSAVVIAYHNIPKLKMPFSSFSIGTMNLDEVLEGLSESGFNSVSTKEVYDIDPDEDDTKCKLEILIGNSNNGFVKGTIVPFDESITVISHYPFEKYNLDIHIYFIPNFIFNKYGINVYLDGEKTSHIEHGKDADLHFRVTEGEHSILFKDDSADNDASGEIKFQVSSDIEAKYKLYCFNSSVDLDEEYVDYKTELAADEIKMSNSESEYIGDNYKSVVAKFKEYGFTNISAVPQYDIIFGITPVESVASVSINGNTDYKRGSVFHKADKVLISYHMNYTDDPEYIEEQKQKEAEKEAKETSSPNTSAATPEDISNTQQTEPPASTPNSTKLDIDSFVKLQDTALKMNSGNGISGHAFRVARTVYIDIYQDGIASAARSVIQSGDHSSWNAMLETLRVRSEDCKNDLDNNGLTKYSCTVQLINDENKDQMLASFTDGELIHDVVRGY